MAKSTLPRDKIPCPEPLGRVAIGGSGPAPGAAALPDSGLNTADFVAVHLCLCDTYGHICVCICVQMNTNGHICVVCRARTMHPDPHGSICVVFVDKG